MIRKITKAFCCLAFLICLTSGNLFATHIMGADLTFVCLGNNSYKFTLKVYRDCSGNPLANTFALHIRSASCNINQTLTLNLISESEEVSPLCPGEILNSRCHPGGSLPGVDRNVYEGTTLLTQDCSDYIFYVEDCCRNAALQNTIVYNSATTGMRVVATLNKMLAPCDNSPDFSALPVPYICTNQLVNYNHGGYDPDGDSLVYNLVPPFDDGGSYLNSTPIQYRSPWSSFYPLSTTTGTMDFDMATGQITMIPSTQMFTVLAVRIDEYRAGQLIGSTMRDIQVVVRGDCNNTSPALNGSQFQNMTGGVQVTTNRVDICPDHTLTFETIFSDSSHHNITMSSNASVALKGATFNSTLFKPDSGKVLITWTPTGLDTGTHVITVTVKNDACPIIGQSVYSYIISVPKSTWAGPDITVCQASSAQLFATGGAKFTWSPAEGLSSTTIRNPVASPTVTTTYIVESDLSSNCKNRDTVVVVVVPAITVLAQVNTPTICSGNSIQLSGSVNGGSGPGYNFSWTNNKGTFTSDQINTSDSPASSVTYYFTANFGNCIGKDSVKVTVNPTPSSDFTINPSSVCQNQNSSINYSGIPAGLTFNWTWNGGIISGSSSGPYVVHWSTEGTKTITLKVTSSNTCTSTTPKSITVNPKPNASFTPSSPVTGCDPLSVNFQNNYAGDVSKYSWIFGDNGTGSSKAISHNYSTGTFSVMLILESSQGCKDTVSKTDLITVNPTPSSDFTISPANICQTDEKTLANYLGNPSGLVFDWTWNGGKISGSGSGPYNVYWTSPGSKSVKLKVTNNFNCSSETPKTITVFEKPVASFTALPDVGCEPLTVNFQNNSSGDIFTYRWTLDDNVTSDNKSPSHIYLQGTYSVTLITETSHNCKDTAFQSNLIHVGIQPHAEFTTDAPLGDTIDLSQAKFNFINKSTGATDYKWFFDDLTSSVETNPSHEYTAIGVYYVTLVAYNNFCTDTFRISVNGFRLPIIVVSYDDIQFPSAFSPNGDGKNDLFRPLPKKNIKDKVYEPDGVTNLSFKVFNRWGNLVFETDRLDGAWDGSYLNNGKPLEVGVYVYYAKAQMINGSSVEKKGNVTLVK